MHNRGWSALYIKLNYSLGRGREGGHGAIIALAVTGGPASGQGGEGKGKKDRGHFIVLDKTRVTHTPEPRRKEGDYG